MKKKLLLLVLAVCVVWGAFCGMTAKSKYSIGSRVTFGTYEQDNNTKNGPEPIEWYVLDVDGNYALLLSRYVLDAQRFNDCWAEITWDDSSVRWWLNHTFLDEAFSAIEYLRISGTSVPADKNHYYSSLNPGKETYDQVFLLSVPEVEKYLKKDSIRMTSATDYARKQGAFISQSYFSDNRGCAWWWLRSPGGYQGTAYKSYAAMIDGSGAVSGHEVYNSGYDGSIGGIRPAIWVLMT